MRLEERCCDLAVAMCIASALIDAPMPKNTVCLGEISLTGEVAAQAGWRSAPPNAPALATSGS